MAINSYFDITKGVTQEIPCIQTQPIRRTKVLNATAGPIWPKSWQPVSWMQSCASAHGMPEEWLDFMVQSRLETMEKIWYEK